MAEGGDQLSSFIVVNVEGDLKDLENDDSVYQLTKAYLEDVQRSGGGKFVSGGFVKKSNSPNLQYIGQYANSKSVERVLKRHEHCIEVNKTNLFLTVRPCLPDLKKTVEKETPSSTGEGDGTSNSSIGESRPVEEGQSSSGSSSFEVYHAEKNDFIFADLNKSSRCRHAKSRASSSSFKSNPRGIETSSSLDALKSPKSIIVKGVSSQTVDVVEVFLENSKKGGGPIKEFAFNDAEGEVSVIFEDELVAEKFLSLKSFKILDNTFYVSSPERKKPKDTNQKSRAENLEEEEEECQTVEVHGVNSPEVAEIIVGLMKNQKKGGGEIERESLDEKRGILTMLFQDKKIADRFLAQKSISMMGKSYEIGASTKEAPKSILHKDVETFKDIETEERSQTVEVHKRKEVAASFLKKEIVEFKGQCMLVTKHEDQAAGAGDGKDSDDNASTKEQPRQKYTASGSFNTVKVSGIPETASKEMISMYFENKKRSGGGRLRVLEYQKEKGKAVIKFDNPEDGQEVCSRPHVLSGATLKTSALEMPLDDVKNCAIEVKGLGEAATEVLLELYFESTGRSGGGTVENVFIDKEAKTAIVVFKEATAVLGVMQKEPHKLDGASLEVNVLEAAPPPPQLLSDVDSTRLLAKRLPPSTTREGLGEYLSPAAKAEIVGWTLAVKPSTALLEFSSEPDYLSMLGLVCSKPFLGKMISIRRVPLTSSILVTGMPSSTTTEFVAMYFENRRNGGTEEECKVEVLPDNRSAIVKFERPEIIHAITSRQHHFEKKQVKVEPYYPWLGLSSASESSGTVAVKTKSEIPTSLTLTVDVTAVHFILKHPELQKYIEDSLEKLNCCVEWSSEGKGEVKLEYKGQEEPTPISGWDIECKKVLKMYTDELTWKKENILQEIWNDFKKKIQEHAAQKSKLLGIVFENDQCAIQYMGLKKDTDEFEKLLMKIKWELEKELERKKKIISETVTNLKPHQLALIRAEEFQKQLRQELPDLEFEVQQTEVNLCGMPDVVKKARLFIMEKFTGAVQDAIEISETMSRVFSKDETKPYLMEQLLSKGISASWICNNRSVIVFALDAKNLMEAVEVLKKEVVEMHIQLSRASEILVQSSQWKEFIRRLYTDNKSLEVAVRYPTVVAVCTRTIAESVQRGLNGFIERHTVLEKIVPMDLGVVDMITKYMKDELLKIEAELKESSGSINASNDEPGFTLRGNETGIVKAAKDLNKLTDSIAMYDYEIDRPGIPPYFQSKSGSEALRGIQIRHKVSIQVNNTQSQDKPQAVASDEPEICRVEVRPGKFMILTRGDITKRNVDAIINAANEDLKNYGGVAAAIAEAGGPELEADCLARIKLEGPLLPGQACITRAGNLPCKKVIHAVGPRWEGGNADEGNILAMAVDSSLNAADNEGLKSVAIPSISTGIFGFPLDQATDIIVDAAKNYLVDYSSTTVREVFFTDIDSRAVASLERKLRTIQADGPQELRETKKDRRVVAGSQDSRSTQNQTPSPSTIQRDTWGTRYSGFQPMSRDAIQTADGVKISLVKGSISEVKADVLVNTTGKALNVSRGNVSKSLLMAAGSALQSEVDAKKPPNFDYGQIVVTGGHMLQCKYVYHGSCREWDNGAGKCEQIVRTFMRNLLERAEGDKQKSIAIPAIGTGNLGIPHRIVAEIMYSEVEKFSSQCKPRNLLDIRFIVYDKDRESIMAFEEKIYDLLHEDSSRGAAASYAPPLQMAPSGAFFPPPASASSMASSGPEDHAGAMERTRPIGGPRKESQKQPKRSQSQHLNRIILSIYALSKEAIDEVVNDIEDVIKENIFDKVLDSLQDQESIAKLDPEQVKRIKDMKITYPVQIEVETGRVKRIRIRGSPREVTSATDEVYNIFQEVHKKEMKQKEEEWIATMAYWEFEDENDFKKYPNEINAIIEKSYRDRKPYAEWEEENAKYRLTFHTMVEEFMTKSGTPPIKVRRITKEIDVPACWETLKNDEVFKRFPLNRHDQEYNDIVKAVLSTAQPTVPRIVMIERIQNNALYKQYIVRKAAIGAANPDAQNERTLWHGTSADTLDSINRTGFNRSYCGKNAVMYGRGVYFAKNFSYSAQNTYSPPDANGYKHIYQCKVLTGEYAVGNQSMIVPPSKPGSTTINYDSTVDFATNPTVFVIFYDTQAYPEYLIYFK